MFIESPSTPEACTYWDRERELDGHVSNWSRAWAWRPDVAEGFVALRKTLMQETSLDVRELAVLVCATTRTLGDSYCALAWGSKLASVAGPRLAGAVLRGESNDELTARESALRDWAQRIVRDPNGTSRGDVEALRSAGLSDKEIFEATAFVAFRLAFSVVNDALGAVPDAQLKTDAPAEVRDAVTWGRQASP